MTTTHVAVAGGALAVEQMQGSTEPVLAIHGINSQRRLWDWLGAEAPEISLVAPDLRGRGDSIDVAGPSSIARHGDDMVAVLDALGLAQVHVCGMSMGGFVAIDLAHRYPDRVKSLVLVDGGFPVAPPPGLTPEALPAVFADRLDRLEKVWSSLDDYLDFFTSSTAPLVDPRDPLLRGYLAHDLRDGVVRLSGEALLSDAQDVFFGVSPWEQLEQPIRLLHAEWGSGPDSPPFYSPEALERYRSKAVSVRYAEGLDHAGAIMTKAGAALTGDLLREALA